MNTIPAKNRRVRIALLNILKTEYPAGLDLKVLRFALDNLGYPMSEPSMRAHLKYLEEKGYLKTEDKRKLGFDIGFSYLTARGWDLLDGNLDGERGVDEEI